MAFASTALALAPDEALAVPLETFIMPGEVIEGHADVETECTACHERFQKQTQDQLCLECHEDVGADIRSKEGFHGLSPGLADVPCKSCHTDHRGRGADIVQLDRQTFNHDFTDHPLEGAHVKLVCDACHASDKKFREAPTRCIDCHADDDVHKGRLGEDCQDCHTEQAWKEAKFDHDTTDFPLRGKHREVGCNLCHANERYEDTPQDCYSCHRLNDVHGGTRGRECDSCHTPSGWKEVSFDHDRDTRFALEGRHGEIACGECHKESPYGKLDMECVSCHANDDVHKGRHGESCEKCHAPQSWTKPDFDHATETDFPLRGKHEQVRCESCHRGPVYEEELSMDCYSCHRGDDVHRGTQGTRCERCHNENGWFDRVVFDHDLTRFPLIGLHATVPCEECHLSGEFKDTPAACVDCHEEDDIHKRSLGRDCARCHTPNAWMIWTFDHDRETDFPLEGAHAGLACDACHREPAGDRIEMSTACISCHRGDDVHSGRFGRNCAHCHTTESFRDLKVLQ